MRGLAALSRAIVEVGQALNAGGLVTAAEGNISARLGDTALVCTAAGCRKGQLTTADLVVTDLTGRPLWPSRRGRRPSSEIRLHVEIYARRPDLAAVVHAHPPTATAFTLSGRELDIPLTAETVVVLGRIGRARYGMPGTPELPATLAGVIETAEVVMLDHHGAVTGGLTVWDALNKMETLERHAVMAAGAMALGGIVPLPAVEVAKLRAYRDEVYLPGLRSGLAGLGCADDLGKGRP